MTWAPANVTNGCFQSADINSCQPSFLTFLTYLTQVLGNSKDDKKNNLENENSSNDNKYDFIIVGAGSAGCVVANRLSEIKNWRILLIEGGGEEPEVADVPGVIGVLPGSNIDYNYVSQNDDPSVCENNPFSCIQPRGKVMGGTSVINGMIYSRGNKQDFNDWAASGNYGWSWDEVLPYFKKSEDLQKAILNGKSSDYGTGGYLGVDFAKRDENLEVIHESWKELGLKEIDYNSGKQVGTARTQFTLKNGTRQSTNVAFIRPIRNVRKNLVIKTNSRVKKVIINRFTRKAIGVDYVIGNEKIERQAYATKEIILSAGAVDSAKLLMLSGIGPRKELLKAKVRPIQYSAVGSNLQDHVGVSFMHFVVDKEVSFESTKDKQNDIDAWISDKTGPLSSPSILGIMQFFQSSFESRAGIPDLQMHYDPVMDNDETRSYKSDYSILRYYNKMRVLPTLTAPRSRGRVELNLTNPIWGNPVIYPNYFNDSHDLEVLKEGIKLSNNITETQPFKNSGIKFERTPAPDCEKFLNNNDNYYECIAKRYHVLFYHLVGTCKMGPKTDRQAVVNPRLKVYGVQSLRVVDGSIMPTIVRGNTNGPIIMIGEKASDMIKQDWKELI